MSKQANKTLIGLFVLGAIALFVATVLVLGGGKFLKKSDRAVMFFDGSIKGLSVGAPVMFRGVKIGSVDDIKLIMDARDLSITTPVVIELDPERWVLVGGTPDVKRMKELIARGLRAQLQMQSFLTGQLMIALDLFPDKPAKFVGRMPEYPEIPTVPAPLAELTKTIENLPIQKMADDVSRTLEGVEKLVNSPDMKENIRAVHETLAETRKTLKETRIFVANLNSKVGPLAANAEAVAADTRASLKQSQVTMKAIEGDVADVSASVKKSLDSADATLRQAEKTLATYSGNSELVHEMESTLSELSETSRAIREFFDYMERHPEAVIKGKPKPEGGTK